MGIGGRALSGRRRGAAQRLPAPGRRAVYGGRSRLQRDGRAPVHPPCDHRRYEPASHNAGAHRHAHADRHSYPDPNGNAEPPAGGRTLTTFANAYSYAAATAALANVTAAFSHADAAAANCDSGPGSHANANPSYDTNTSRRYDVAHVAQAGSRPSAPLPQPRSLPAAPAGRWISRQAIICEILNHVDNGFVHIILILEFPQGTVPSSINPIARFLHNALNP